MLTKKPASKSASSATTFRRPTAHLNDFCFFLGVNTPPNCESSAVRIGRAIAEQWANFPRALKSARNINSSLECNLMALPDDSKEFRIAERMIQGMLLDVPRSLLLNEEFNLLVCSFRTCLIRTPERHLAAICTDLGVGVPRSHRDAERMGTFVVEALHQPIHAQRMVQRRSALYHSLKALPEGSREHKMAKALVIRVTNPKRVPKSTQRTEGYRQVATTLRQALKLI